MNAVSRAPADRAWQYHPLEIVVRPSHPDSLLASRLVELLASEHRVGFVRHGATVEAQASGGTRIAVDGSGLWAGLAVNGKRSLFLQAGHLDLATQRSLLSEAELVVVEGDFQSRSPTVIELRSDGTGLLAAGACGAANPVALVGSRRPTEPLPPGGLPWFHEQDHMGLLDHLLDRCEAGLRARPFWALLLPSGLPGDPAAQETARSLFLHCERLFVGSDDPAWRRLGLEPLANMYPAHGDLGQILSALTAFPETGFLVCDTSSPTRLAESLPVLCRERRPLRTATAFRERDTHLPQRFPAIWEPKARTRIHSALASDVHCLQRILTLAHIHLLDPIPD